MTMDEREKRLLRALARMVEQYHGAPNNNVWSQGLSAAEAAMRSLVEYGAVREVQGCLIGEWTDFGMKVLSNDFLISN
jgi:hypothetical protein